MCGIFLYACPTGGPQEGQFAEVAAEFDKIKHRGPDNSSLKKINRKDSVVYIGFHRLAIMDPSENGDQPFEYKDATCVCNGEIYNYKEIANQLIYNNWYECMSGSDCEVILPLFRNLGMEQTCDVLDGEFAFIIYDHQSGQIFAGTDFLRTRPLFIGHGVAGSNIYAISSEIKSLQNLPGITSINPFPPGTWWSSNEPFVFNKYTDSFSSIRCNQFTDLESIHLNVNTMFTNAVKVRMSADQDIGFFLSGGVDSSLCSLVGSKLSSKPIMTFTASFSPDGPDILASRKVVEKIKSNHHEVIFSIEDGIAAIPRTIKALESYCCTTVRASVPQLLLSEWIHTNYPNIKVMISGENADETFCGYEYFKYAPSAVASRNESIKLLENVHLYDALRADRTVSSVGIELRVPFTDRTLVEYVLSLQPEIVRAPTPEEMKQNVPGEIPRFIEKKILRDAFKDQGLPESVLYRSKMGLSDSCSMSWVDSIKRYAEETVNSNRFELRHLCFPINTPRTKEEFMYREIFERMYPNNENIINGHWMPNQDWFDTPLTDPSARIIGTFVGK
jgi:asparagine synthase (glutamine-hydrolysing)